MTGRLTPVSWKEFVRKLKILGFEGPYKSGKHFFMTKLQMRLTIPNPHKQDINVHLLKKYLIGLV